jgi:hypothetical protein
MLICQPECQDRSNYLLRQRRHGDRPSVHPLDSKPYARVTSPSAPNSTSGCTEHFRGLIPLGCDCLGSGASPYDVGRWEQSLFLRDRCGTSLPFSSPFTLAGCRVGGFALGFSLPH